MFSVASDGTSFSFVVDVGAHYTDDMVLEWMSSPELTWYNEPPPPPHNIIEKGHKKYDISSFFNYWGLVLTDLFCVLTQIFQGSYFAIFQL